MKRISFFLSFVCLFLINSIFLFSQQYHIENYTETDGLISSIVNDVRQDTLGRMWFATRGGVSVYNGYNWRSYPISSGLAFRPYRLIRVDEKGLVWVVPEYGRPEILYLENDTWQVISIPMEADVFMDCPAFAVTYWNDSPVLAVGTRYKGVYLFHDNEWTHLNTPDLPDARIRTILPWNERLMILTYGGLCAVDTSGLRQAESFNRQLPSQKLLMMRSEIIKDRVGSLVKRLWIMGEGWVGYFIEGQFTKLNIAWPFSETNSYHLTFRYLLQPDGGDGLYLGWNSLLYFHFATQKVIKLDQSNGLVANSPDQLYLDREGNVWALTFRGISKIVSLRFANYNNDQGLLENEVTAIIEWRPGVYVLGHNSGLTIFDGESCRQIPFKNPLSIHSSLIRVLDMAVDEEGYVWVAASGLGLGRMDSSERLIWFRRGSSRDNSTRSVLVDRKNDVWAVDDDGLFKVENGRIVPVQMRPEVKNNIRKLVSGPYNKIYITSSAYGVFEYDGIRARIIIPDTLPTARSVYTVLPAGRDSLFIGAMSGLYLWDGRTVHLCSWQGEAVDRPVFGLIKDRDGRLWIGTDNGMIVVDEGRLTPMQRAHGFVGKEINRGALCLDTKGRLLLGTDLGMSIYDPDLDNIKKDCPPIVHFLNLEVDGEKISLDKPVDLNYNQNIWVCHFYGNSLVNEELLSFRLKLEGFDKDWIENEDLSHRQIRYTNLPPGQYRFLLQAVNAQGVWSPVVSSESIVIGNPFWKSVWFILVVIGVLLLSLYAAFKYLSDKRQARTLTQLVKERTRQLEESEEKYRLVAENPIDGIVMLQEGRIFWVNHTFFKLFGYYENEILQHSLKRFLILDESQRLDWETMRLNREQNHYEIRARHKSGDVMEVEVFTSDLFYYQKKPTVLTLFRDITEKKRADEKIKASLKEKEILLKEVHHRVKNNLQIISSLLSLQSRQIKNQDVLDMFVQSQNRVRSMALLHEKIYQSEDFARINFASYIRGLTTGLYRVYHIHPGAIAIDLDVNEVALDIDQAVPCGLVINELLSNAMKYAFPDSFQGEARIGVILKQQDDGFIELVLEDNGVGLPPDFNLSEATSLGMKLVHILVTEQLHGELQVNGEGGARFNVRFSTKTDKPFSSGD